jgi:fatty-acyl-CoA synthase
MLVNAEGKQPLHNKVNILTAGAPPPAAVVLDTEKLGFEVLQMYGLSETFGQVLVSESKEEYATLPDEERAKLKARQGVPVPLLGGDCIIGDADTCVEQPRDGATMGEILIRGNLVMKGYLKNPEVTEECFAGGWFHSGDVAVCNPDGYIQIKDRSKDVIISGGENISTVEVEEALYSHPAVMEAAVVAEPHPKWQEVPCAFVTTKAGVEVTDSLGQEIIEHCKGKLAKFKVPKRVVFKPLPRNGAGKIQKFVLRDEARELAGQSKL